MIERPFFTLSQAAKETGRSKGTISNALKKGRLSYTRENGEYRIDGAELFRVYPLDVSKNDKNERGSTLSNDALNAKLEAAERLLHEREETISDLRHRLDTEAEERRRLTMTLTDQRPKQQEQPAQSPQEGRGGRFTRAWAILTAKT